MVLHFKKLHSSSVAECSPIDLRQIYEEDTIGQIHDAVIQYGVLVFKKQKFSHQEQLDFARRLDSELYSHTSLAILAKNRFGNEALTDISNVDSHGNIFKREDRRRLDGICNQIWHTDASFEQPSGRYSMLFARNVPCRQANTQLADMR